MNKTNVIQEIPLDALVPREGNRKVGGFPRGELEELAATIKKIGVQQPAVVRPLEEGIYQIVAGERRWKASRLAGRETLPCIVRTLSDSEALLIHAVENLARENVHPLDEAASFSELLEQGYTAERIAEETGRSPALIYQRLRLRDLIDDARDLFANGTLTLGHASLIARLDPERQDEALEHFEQASRYDPVTVEDLDDWIKSELLMNLRNVQWKLDDATLLPEAGACFTCPKRTGAQEFLFQDMANADACMDRECFENKGKAIVERQRVKLAKQKPIEVTTSYGNQPRGTIHKHDITDCKKSDKDARPVLHVDGPNAGKVTYGKLLKGAQKNEDQKEELKAARKHELAVGKARAELHNAIFSDAIEAAGKSDLAHHGYPHSVLRLCFAELYYRAGNDAQNAIKRAMGWAPDRLNWPSLLKLLEKMDSHDLYRFLLVQAMAPHLKPNPNQGPEVPRSLRLITGALGVSLESKAKEIAKANGLKEKDINPEPLPRWDEREEDENEDK